jgi:hypothetical protein
VCGTLVRVSNAELRQRAEALGVQVIFWDWQGRETTVPDETLEAIVAVLGDVPPPPAPAARAGAPAPRGGKGTCATSLSSPPGRRGTWAPALC